MPAQAYQFFVRHEPGWGAVWLGGVVADGTLKANRLANHTGQILDCDVFADADINMVFARIVLHQVGKRIGAVIYV